MSLLLTLSSGPNEILFSNPTEPARKQKRGPRRQPKVLLLSSPPSPQLPQLKDTAAKDDELPIRLLTVRCENVIVGAFHRSPQHSVRLPRMLLPPLTSCQKSYDLKLQKILSTIATQFVKTYSAQLDALRSKGVFRDIIEVYSSISLLVRLLTLV